MSLTAQRLPEQAVGQVLTYRDALATVMDRALAQHPEVLVMGQGVDDFKGTFGTTLGLADRYGSDRVFDTPLSEEATAGIAMGAALAGLYPITIHIRADFALLAMNQLVNLAAKYKYMSGGRLEVPMLVRMVIGRSWGQGAQHSQSLQSLFAHIPGLTVFMPASAESILQTYPHVISECRGPVIALEHRLMYDLQFRVGPVGSSAAPSPSPLGARRLRHGRDVTLVATSIMVVEALRAADHLSAHGIECTVIDLNCVSAIDADMIMESVSETGRLVVADTSWQAFGVCAEVARLVCERDPGALRAPLATLGMAPAPCPTAKSLEDLYYPNLRVLVDRVATLVSGSPSHGVPLPDESSMADVYKRFKGPF